MSIECASLIEKLEHIKFLVEECGEHVTPRPFVRECIDIVRQRNDATEKLISKLKQLDADMYTYRTHSYERDSGYTPSQYKAAQESTYFWHKHITGLLVAYMEANND